MLRFDVCVFLLLQLVWSLVYGTLWLQMSFLSAYETLSWSHCWVLAGEIGTLFPSNYLARVHKLVPKEDKRLVACGLREDIGCVEGCVNLGQLQLTTSDSLANPVVSDADVF